MKLLILGVHQSHVKAYAGGYVRLREFLKRIPPDIDYKIVDISPSIYEDVVGKDKIILLESPYIVKLLLAKLFPLGVLFERIWTIVTVYRTVKEYIHNEKSLLYVPTAELLHLYLPAIMLKKEFPKTKLVFDILNFEVLNENILSLIKRFHKTFNLITSIEMSFVHYFTYIITKKTINDIDYIFTVSPQLIKTIKSIYKKETIDYTPSGVNISSNILRNTNKKYQGVYIGRITEQKGIFNLLETWAKVVEKESKAKLAIAGIINPELTSLVNEKINHLKLSRNIEVFESISEKKKFDIISKGEIFLHLANYEPLFPVIGILEGLSYGLPCIVFDMPVLRLEVDKMENNNFIFVVKNGNIEKVSEIVVNYINYAKRKKSAVFVNARNYASKFNWTEISKKEFKIIRDLIKEKS